MRTRLLQHFRRISRASRSIKTILTSHLAVASVVGVMIAAPPANAITNGEPDGNDHPNVGVLVDAYITPGFYEPFCSATLVAPTLMVSSAHCFWGYPLDHVWVSFDAVHDSGPMPPIHATAVLHPQFQGLGPGNAGRSFPHDVAVLHLDTPVSVAPAHLAPLGLLDALDLRTQNFDIVGYGMTRDSKTAGPNSLEDNFDPVVRTFGTAGFHSLQKEWITFSQNIAKGESGWCYGDSGSAAYLAGTDTMIALASNVDNSCRAMGTGPRLDTPSVQQFLASQGVPLR